MSIIKTTLVAASLLTFAAVTAHADSREDLESGYHGNSPVWVSPYGPSDAIEEGARGAYGQAGGRAPDIVLRHQPRVRHHSHR